MQLRTSHSSVLKVILVVNNVNIIEVSGFVGSLQPNSLLKTVWPALTSSQETRLLSKTTKIHIWVVVVVAVATRTTIDFWDAGVPGAH